MARAAVKAKQQERAKAQTAKPARSSRGRRRHAGGGDPNQQLFFTRLRRRQKWVFLALAIVFAATFAGVGVGSGNSAGLSDLYSGLFGGSGNDISKAQADVKLHPVKGYRELATAYEAKSDSADAITALQSYLGLRKKDPAAWSELGGLQQTQGQAYAQQYQQVQQAAQAADPASSFTPGGTLGQAIGSNPLSQSSSQQVTSQENQLYQQAAGAFNSALTSYQRAAKLQPHSGEAQFLVATAAENAGQYPTAVTAFKRYLQLDPHSPQKAQVESLIQQLTAATKKKK